MNKIDEIALRVADKYDPRENYFPYRNDLLLYVKELLAELSKDAAPVSASEQKPVALPFAIFDEELRDLNRFHECVTDGEGYDVPKARMKRLAEIGLLRRVSADYYEHTTFGLSVINGDFDTSPHNTADIDQLRAENEALHTKLAQFTKWNSELTAKCNWYNCDGARLEREIEVLKQQVEQGKRDAVLDWMPIETAPKDCGILGYQRMSEDTWIIAPMYWYGSEWLIIQFHSDNTEHSMQPTHWQPIAAAPKQEK